MSRYLDGLDALDAESSLAEAMREIADRWRFDEPETEDGGFTIDDKTAAEGFVPYEPPQADDPALRAFLQWRAKRTAAS
jgi:hypothetical protein